MNMKPMVKLVLYHNGRQKYVAKTVEEMACWCQDNGVPLVYPVDFDLMLSADWSWKCVVEYDREAVRNALRCSTPEEWKALDHAMYDREINGRKGTEPLNFFFYQFLKLDDDLAHEINTRLKEIGFQMTSHWVFNAFRKQPKGIV